MHRMRMKVHEGVQVAPWWEPPWLCVTDLRPGRGEPLGAGSLEAGGAGLWCVGVVTAAVWELFEHAGLQAHTHHRTPAHAAAAGSVTLQRSKRTALTSGLEEVRVPTSPNEMRQRRL